MREFDLIKTIVGHNAALPERVMIPPGDDMAAIRVGDETLLLAADQIVDRVHFDLSSTPIPKIGRKAVTRNLSDVAAMAAHPVATLASVVLPVGMDQSLAEQLFDALRDTAETFGCPVIGGDTATHDGPLTLSVTILAEPAGVEPVTRQGAKPGDAIYVTGQLGGSLHEYDGVVHHLDFEPRLDTARALAGDDVTRPAAMIDLSDGLARDLPHLAPGALIHARALPVSPIARQRSARDGRPGWMHAVADGEDYELLFTARPDAPIPDELAGVRVSRVGEIVETPGIVLKDGLETISLDGLGWEHHG